MTKFHLVTRFIAEKQSFRQACGPARAAKEVSNTPNFGEVAEATLRQFVKVKKAINLQHIRKLILDTRCWTYSIDFDAAI